MSPDIQPVNKALLGKYLAGEPCTQEELDSIKEYFTNDAYAPAIRQLMEAEWLYLQTVDTGEARTDDHYQRFVQAKLQPYLHRRGKVVRLFRQSMKYAAVLAFLLIGIKVITWFGLGKQQPGAIHWEERMAGRGQQLKLTLPDSTIIYLAPESHIWYPSAEHYLSGKRTIRLEGEAYFEVKHNDKHPFAVHTGALQTIDVGTAFNIRAYAGEPRIEVAVAEGEVQVVATDPAQQTISKNLIASQGVVYDNKLQRLDQVMARADEIGRWRKGVFEFSDETLENVVAVIARHYNLQFAWQDLRLKKKKITIQFHGDQRATALKMLELTAGIRLQEKDNIMWISKK